MFNFMVQQIQIGIVQGLSGKPFGSGLGMQAGNILSVLPTIVDSS